jgi:hypothetical protein
MKHFLHILFLSAVTVFHTSITAQGQNSAKVYWIGHSLVDRKNWSDPNAKNLIELMEELADAGNKSYSYHRHTIPGAPIGWNWGVSASWGQVKPMIAPLTDPEHSEYGTFDVMVLTEGVNLESSYDAWASSFYARKFFNAARKANPDTRLFLYESWHHYNAGDFRDFYGPQATFNWREYMIRMRSLWETIADEAADPAKTAVAEDYVYQGTGADPGNSDARLKINIIPTGKVLVAVLDRILEKRPNDNWTYSKAAINGKLSGVDFFQNPLLNFPADLTTTVHGGELDDIHASPVLIYLNALTHYAVIYGENPANLPAAFDIPPAIARIFKEIVWDVVSKDPGTGLAVITNSDSPVADQNHSGNTTGLNVIYDQTTNKIMLEYKGKNTDYILTDLSGRTVKSGITREFEIENLKSGVYIINIQGQSKRIVKY